MSAFFGSSSSIANAIVAAASTTTIAPAAISPSFKRRDTLEPPQRAEASTSMTPAAGILFPKPIWTIDAGVYSGYFDGSWANVKKWLGSTRMKTMSSPNV